MIKLKKTLISEDMVQRINERSKRFSELSGLGSPIPESLASAYKSPEIKTLLREETADKCAYCESKVPHIDYGDVEHIQPKSKFPELRYSYENLTYVCGVCNTKKGSFFSVETPLLNPYKDLPDDHLMPVGPMILRQPTSDRGLITQKILDLNRSELVERRQERLESIATLVDQAARTKNQTIKSVLLEQISEECDSDKEYCFVARAYVASIQAKL